MTYLFRSNIKSRHGEIEGNFFGDMISMTGKIKDEEELIINSKLYILLRVPASPHDLLKVERLFK